MNNISENKQSEKSLFLDYILILLKWKYFLLLTFILSFTISTIISFMLPKIYFSSASVLPPKEETSMLGAGGFGGLTSVFKELSSIKGMGSLGNRNTYNYLVILNSKDVFDSVIHRFNLMEVYGIPDNSREKAIKALSEKVSFEIQEEGNLEIGVFDENPKLAADVANYFVELLSKKSYELNVQETSKTRLFIEKRVQENMDSLTISENKLKEYQEKYQIYTMPEQTSSIVDASSKLYAEKTKKEIELNYLENYVTKDNPLLESSRFQLDALNKRINQLPNLGLEYLRIYRDIYIRIKILEFLRPSLEQVSYQEKKNTPVIVVVDYARPAEYKSKPKKMVIIASAVVGALMLSLLFIGIVEKWKTFKMSNQEYYNKLKSGLRFK